MENDGEVDGGEAPAREQIGNIWCFDIIVLTFAQIRIGF
jgi:hypothetical protein